MRLILVSLTTLVLTSCIDLVGERGNGIRVEESFTVDDFEKIDVGGAFIVKITQENSNEITLEADENLVDYIEIGVHGSTLEVNSDRRLDSKDGIIVNIPVKSIRAITCSGASDVSTTTPLQSEKLNIVLSGAGKLELMLDVGDVSVDVSGATLVYLEGSAKTLDINMSGAGSLEASEMEVEDCFAQISGIGKILVNVTGTLDADVSGLGSVEYVGDPENVKGDVSGVGNVSRK